jgi:hypothetical protein
LVKALPPDSAVHRADPDKAGWTVTDHLLALVAEAADMAGWRAVQPYMKKGAIPEPLRVPRPGQQTGRRPPSARRVGPDELQRMYEQRREVTDGAGRN